MTNMREIVDGRDKPGHDGTLLPRHARTRSGHPRVLGGVWIDVDGRDKPGHDENVFMRVSS